MALGRLDVALARLPVLLVGLGGAFARKRVLTARLGRLRVRLGPGPVRLSAAHLGLATDLARLVAARLEFALLALAAEQHEQRQQNQRGYDDGNDQPGTHTPGLLPRRFGSPSTQNQGALLGNRSL